MSDGAQSSSLYDVIIVGGALAGASTAILLLREQPDLKVLVVEKSPVFTRRVGEATVEVSAYFLGRVLGLTGYLNEAHLVKQGMRFWFANERTRSLEDASEIGGSYLARVPAYQVDRSALDEEVFRRAEKVGAKMLRPASVEEIGLVARGTQSVTVRYRGTTEKFEARWVVDASGVAAILARRNGWFQPNTAHPTTAVWARWDGLKDWDGYALAERFPRWASRCHGIRATATNHFVGSGWWAWCIPLKGGQTSVGLVLDQRMVELPGTGSLGERLKAFLLEHQAAREILGDARWEEGDVHWRKNLAYSSSVYAGDGFVIVGDAGAFLDPLYSPGLDWLAFTVTRSVDLILAERRGEDPGPLVASHNREFIRSYERWFEALYLNKYEYLGDFELMRLGFLLDLGLYYLGVAAQPYKKGLDGLREPVFATPLSTPVFHLMRVYNRRFVAMARARRVRGEFGRNNSGRQFMFGGYTFSRRSIGPVIRALFSWMRLELLEGWRTWGKNKEAVTPNRPAPGEQQPMPSRMPPGIDRMTPDSPATASTQQPESTKEFSPQS